MPLTTCSDPSVKARWCLIRRNTHGLQKGRMVSLVVNAFQGVFKPQATARQNKASHLMARV